MFELIHHPKYGCRNHEGLIANHGYKYIVGVIEKTQERKET
jgi:hypothetical protein